MFFDRITYYQLIKISSMETITYQLITKAIKINILVFILIFSCTLSAQEPPSNQIEKLQKISGYVTTDDEPKSKVSVRIRNSNRVTNTDSKGFYSINALPGETIEFSHTGMKPVSILVEDVTDILNIEMGFRTLKLDEVKLKSKISKKEEEENHIFITERGIRVDKRSSNYVAADRLNPAAINLINALRGKVPGLRVYRNPVTLQDEVFLRNRNSSIQSNNGSAIWEIDGLLFFNSPPFLDVAIIESVVVLKSLFETVLYGSAGRNGVIIVTTKAAAIKKRKKEKRYTNQEYYKGDAVSLEDIRYGKPTYLEKFKGISASSVLEMYEAIYDQHKNESNFHFLMVDQFANVLNDKKKASKVLSDYENYANNNPEILKSIAYKYQELGFHKEAIKVYKNLMRIRPKHVQSFRDLANAYNELGEYQDAWKIYRYYLQKGYTLENNPIGQIMASEMTALYMLKKEEAKIKDRMAVDTTENITNDTRIVVEWNTSEAEFILEFVNPDGQVFQTEYSLENDDHLILEAKQMGYNSKEFIIEDLAEGNWLMNLTYLGNKKFAPTYFKVSTYLNWGRPNQKSEIKVYELLVKDTKAQLIKLNRAKL